MWSTNTPLISERYLPFLFFGHDEPFGETFLVEGYEKVQHKGHTVDEYTQIKGVVVGTGFVNTLTCSKKRKKVLTNTYTISGLRNFEQTSIN